MEMTATDIVKILKACRDTGAKTLKLGDLDVTFGELPLADTFHIVDPQAVEPELAHAEVYDPKPTPMDPQTAADLAEIEEAQLILEDMGEWERRQMQGGN